MYVVHALTAWKENRSSLDAPTGFHWEAVFESKNKEQALTATLDFTRKNLRAVVSRMPSGVVVFDNEGEPNLRYRCEVSSDEQKGPANDSALRSDKGD